MIEDILNFFNASKLQLNNVITAFLIEHSPLKLAQISNICTDQIQNIQTDAALSRELLINTAKIVALYFTFKSDTLESIYIAESLEDYSV